MHSLVERDPKKGYRTRCGLWRPKKGDDISGWGSDVTCEACRGR